MIELSSNSINHLVEVSRDNPLQELIVCFSIKNLQFEVASIEYCFNYMDE